MLHFIISMFFTFIVVKQGAKFCFYNDCFCFFITYAGYLFSLLDGYNFVQQNLSLLMGNWHIMTKLTKVLQEHFQIK